MSLTSRLLTQAFNKQPARLMSSATNDAVAKVQAKAGGLVATLDRLAAVPQGVEPGMMDTAGQVYVPATLKDWKLMPDGFKEFPERDLVNFPHPNMPAFPSKVRLGLVPDSWFRFFYDKTGETGGYLFMGGLATTLFSTELFVLDVEFFTPIPHAINIFLLTLFTGGHLAKYMDESVEEGLYKPYATWKERQLSGFKQTVDAEVELQQCYQVINDMLFKTKRENVHLQLEAEYRNRVNTVHETVKRRMEFLSEYENTRRRFTQEHMVKWIMDQVRGSITPQMETATLKQCVSDLKALANKA